MPGPAALPDYRHRTVNASTVPIHVVDLPGQGAPLVLLHGIGMDWRVWQAISRRLHPYFHLYMLDLRGHGASGKPAHGYSLAEYAADVEDVIDTLKLHSVKLIGSSLGGMIAAAVEAPSDVVSHRILVDPPLTGGPIRDAAMFEEILRLKQQPLPRLAAFLGASNPGAGSFFLTAMSEMWHEAADGVITDMLAHPTEYYAIDAALTASDVPTLLMQGNPDRGGVLSSEEAGHALSLLPVGSLVTFPQAGHAIHAHCPVEFVETVLAFTASDRLPEHGLE